MDDHHATLRISPGLLTPPSSPGAQHAEGPADIVKSSLTAALAEANRIFDLYPGHAVCDLCADVAPASARHFKNKRDLAQHLLSKHSHALVMADVDVAAMPAVPVSTRSEMSSNPRKRKLATPPATSTIVKREKRARVAESNTVYPAAVKTKATSGAGEDEITPVVTPVRTAGVKNASSHSGTPSSGSKPPVTPKRTQKAKTVVAPKESALGPAAKGDAKADGVVPVSTNPISVGRAAREVVTTPLDFSMIEMFSTNAQKSYYKLKNR